MTIITVDTDQSYAPGCYLICKVTGEPGHYDWNTHDEEGTILVQVDTDYPGLASLFGWIACECGATDGTIDCPHNLASDMIADAADYLDALCDSSGDKRYVEDPGYFD